MKSLHFIIILSLSLRQNIRFLFVWELLATKRCRRKPSNIKGYLKSMKAKQLPMAYLTIETISATVAVGLHPVMSINREIYGKVHRNRIITIINEYKTKEEEK